MKASWRNLAVVGLLALGIASAAARADEPLARATSTVTDGPTVTPSIWPKGHSPVRRDPKIEAKIDALLRQMTVEEKVGQIVQADLNSTTAEDVKKYRLGSVLVGGNSGPRGNDRAPAKDWLSYADELYAASMDAPPGRPAIPVIWGSDAVHGNANIIGATIFPHNIGLGAMRDPALVKKIGEVTAKELRAVGGDWTFAPTIAVVRDDRWGRTYEGYSEDPRIVKQYAAAMVEGIQGRVGAKDWLVGEHVLATVKHYIGDGGTFGGKDQGDTRVPQETVRDVFAPGYYSAVGAGAQVVMASYNSWYGKKMHGFKPMLTDILRGRMGFDGFVVGDWNGHGQVSGCTTENCPAALKAGLDMYMAPDSWKKLYENTVAQAKSGAISQAELDQAVARVLRVKFRARVFDQPKPSLRPFGGRLDLLGAPEHRAVARQAVRESLVLLKNDGGLLPLKPSLNVLVAGDGADNLAKQTGGWTISWQGNDNKRADFPNGESIFEGIKKAVVAGGGSATLSADGSFSGAKPDVAVVVFGEDPYAEFQGDVPNLDYQPGDAKDQRLLESLKAKGIPVVAVFLSGRPMYVNPELNASDAFVAAFLPGSEGGGVADVLFRNARGAIGYDFKGKLSYSWPKAPDQTPLNVGDAGYDPLFPYGYGLTYRTPKKIGTLPVVATSAANAAPRGVLFASGRVTPPWSFSTSGQGVASARVDRAAQEDALLLTWSGSAPATVSLTGPRADYGAETEADMALSFDVRVDRAPSGPMKLAFGTGAIDISRRLRDGGAAWRTEAINLKCFRQAGADPHAVETAFALSTSAPAQLAVANIRIARGESGGRCE